MAYSKTRISIVIPAKNEEVDLPNTLKSAKFADEILILLDKNSNDNTEKIAKDFGCKIEIIKFEDFATTRNLADNYAQHEWILSIEADVTISQELADEITKVIKENKYSAFKIKRVNQIWNKNILHTNWGPNDDTHIWLYKKGSGKWVGGIHEEYVTTEKVGKLTHPLFHLNYKTVEEFISKMNNYSSKASRYHLKSSPFSGLVDFLRRFIYKQGFLDGYHGLFLSYLQALYHLSLYVKNKTKVYNYH